MSETSYEIRELRREIGELRIDLRILVKTLREQREAREDAARFTELVNRDQEATS
jgi:hypothetical protein